MRTMTVNARRRTAAALVAAAALGLAACENESDPVAPAESTLTVSANPQTVVVPATPPGSTGVTTLTATLRSKNGTRLSDQEITFTTSSGNLTPPAETPILTDDEGQAVSTLETPTSATVTARSGSIMGTTQVQTATGNLSQFQLTVIPQVLTSCNDSLTLTATVRATSGDPVPNILVIFDETSTSTVVGNFNPGPQISTDVDGEATVMWTPIVGVCAAECQASTSDPNNPSAGDCSLAFTASDTTGAFESPPVDVFDSIP